MSDLDLGELPLTGSPGLAIVEAVASGQTTVAETANAHLDVIARQEPRVRAFTYLDPEAVRAAASELDQRKPDAANAPLLGLPIGIKDLIDTEDQPTEYGSALFAGHRPTQDAAVVRTLRKAGALITGKTVTTEFALFSPGPTRNPWDVERTPGGSSSGSAAAVASGMLPVALGTQTAASLIRPASFCGVVGFKPTFDAIDRTGVFPISETLDTVGLLGCSIADISTVFDVLRADPLRSPRHSGQAADGGPGPGAGRRRPRIGFARPVEWELADRATQAALDEFRLRLEDSDMDVVDITLPSDYDALTAAQCTVMDFEVSRNLTSRCQENPALVSRSLLDVLQRGASISGRDYDTALELAARCRAMLPEVLHSVDAMVVPAAVGEAPLSTQGTGNPVFGRSWTLLHCPTISLPLLQGPSGLPLGVQLVGNLSGDDKLLKTAQTLMAWNSAAR